MTNQIKLNIACCVIDTKSLCYERVPFALSIIFQINYTLGGENILFDKKKIPTNDDRSNMNYISIYIYIFGIWRESLISSVYKRVAIPKPISASGSKLSFRILAQHGERARE